jgi:hypothetical protein
MAQLQPCFFHALSHAQATILGSEERVDTVTIWCQPTGYSKGSPCFRMFCYIGEVSAMGIFYWCKIVNQVVYIGMRPGNLLVIRSVFS